MYYVEIDLGQLHTRLMTSRECEDGGDELIDWLCRAGFVRCGEGWMADADAMNRLSCSEITFSELAATAHVPRGVRLLVALEQWRRQHVASAPRGRAMLA